VIRLLVFDLDGTLIDSRRDLADAANALIVERGGAPRPVDAIASMVGEGAALLVRRALKAAGTDLVIERDLPRFLELYDERLLAHTRLYDGTREMLETLRAHATLAVLTNKPHRPTGRILDGLGIAPFFRHVVGGDSAHGRKPDPAGLQHLMSVTGATRADTIMIGDSAIDLRTARAADVRCCLVRYGFGFPTAANELTGADVVIEHPSELAAALLDSNT
jgi:phosphoglycolate phosphatase